MAQYNMFHPDFRKFKYSNYIDYIVYYVGMKYTMKNLESETISAKEIIDFYEAKSKIGYDIPTIAQSNLSTTLKYLKDKKILIDAGFVNRQKRYYFNFNSEFLDMDLGTPTMVLHFSKALTTFVFLSHIKNIDPKLFPEEDVLRDFLIVQNNYDPLSNMFDNIQGFRGKITNGNFCKHLIKKVNGQKWFTGEDYNNLQSLSEVDREKERQREESFTNTLG